MRRPLAPGSAGRAPHPAHDAIGTGSAALADGGLSETASKGRPASGRRPSHQRRVALALAVAVACFASLVAVLGLLSDPVGAGDNGDGGRLYCGAGLVPDVPGGGAAWQGGVVLEFLRAEPCPEPIPSSALPVLRAAAGEVAGTWSLTELAWSYASLVASVAGAAAWASSAVSLRRAAVLLPPALALLDADFARFFASTYSEPAGLLGAFAVFCGVGVLGVTGRRDRPERAVGLLLVAGGGLFAAAAKAGYAPLAVVAVAACAVTAVALGPADRGWSVRLVGPLTALLVVVAAYGPIGSALTYQSQAFGAINAHNLVYTMLLEEHPGATRALGLPADAAASGGLSFYTAGSTGLPGAAQVAAQPAETKRRAWRSLAEHPTALARAVGVGVQATRGRSLPYLPSQPYSSTSRPPNQPAIGEQGAEAASLRPWLDSMGAPWWPSAVLVLGLAAGALGLSRRGRLWSAAARTAGLAALAAVGLSAAAVLGDGYFEIAKHVWLAAYAVDVAALSLVLAPAAAVIRRSSGAGLRPGRPPVGS